MPKIKNWSYDETAPYAKWVHDETGDSIEIGPAAQTEYHNNGTPAEYQITFWSRDGLNNRVLSLKFSSLKKAKQTARYEAKNHPDGKLVRSQREKHRYLEWGEDERSYNDG